MKRKILILVISFALIFTLFLTPSVINADEHIKEVGWIEFWIPHEGRAYHWTNTSGEPITMVIAEVYSEVFGNYWEDKFYMDGSKGEETITGIGTPDIQIYMNPGSMDIYFVKVTFYASKDMMASDMEMKCYQVWINEDNNFEFVFWYLQEDSNWVKIYDMAGNEVFSINMEKDSPSFVAALPDGMYTVKTFHEAEHIIQEFIIGKP